eukprot:7616765-Karenia_brevis.AAC.1
MGASRGRRSDDNVKGSCRLLCPPGRRHEFADWDNQYVHDTMDVLEPDASTTALGAPIGGRE